MGILQFETRTGGWHPHDEINGSGRFWAQLV